MSASTGVGGVDSGDHWERHAGWWQEGFSEGADPEYEEQMLPLAAEHLAGARAVLDVGCGEGQVSRLAAATGAGVVVGVDPAWAQVAEARRRGAGGGAVPAAAIRSAEGAFADSPTGGRQHYGRAAAAALPFRDAAFDAVVACLVFEHILAVDDAIAEVSRVLVPGGRFLFFLNHPLLQTPNSGWIDDQILDPPEQYWRIGRYLDESVMLEEVAKGVHLPYVHRPLSRYVNALVTNGLSIELMLEPPPPPGFLALAPEYEDAASIPRLLFLRCTKRVAP